jgi:multidrug resistance protein
MLAAFSVSVFLIGFGAGPLILAPLSETFGRKPVYVVGFTIFTLTQIPCALSTNVNMLIGFRFLSGFFGSASIANGGGTISDMYTALERTRVVGWYILGPLTGNPRFYDLMVGPAVGPVIGGFMTEKLSWKWTFWLMLILSTVNTIFCVVFLQETYAPVLLARKAAKLQKSTGQPHRPAVYDPRSLPHRIYHAVQRPLKILFLQPIVFIMAVYMALIYGTLYLLFTTFPQVFQGIYGMSVGISGLAYLGIGIGFTFAILFGIPQIDKQYRRLTAKNGGVSLPEFRLPVANVGAVCIPVSLLWYGWSVEAQTYFLVPIIGISLLVLF